MTELKELLLLVAAGQKAILFRLDEMPSLEFDEIPVSATEDTYKARHEWAILYEKVTQVEEPSRVCKRCHTTLVPDDGQMVLLVADTRGSIGPLCRTCFSQVREDEEDTKGRCDNCGKPLVKEDGRVFLLPREYAEKEIGPLCQVCADHIRNEE